MQKKDTKIGFFFKFTYVYRLLNQSFDKILYIYINTRDIFSYLSAIKRGSLIVG